MLIISLFSIEPPKPIGGLLNKSITNLHTLKISINFKNVLIVLFPKNRKKPRLHHKNLQDLHSMIPYNPFLHLQRVIIKSIILSCSEIFIIHVADSGRFVIQKINQGGTEHRLHFYRCNTD